MSSPHKSIIVTGGASGIGLAMTKYFAEQGHKIAVLDVNASQGPSIISAVQDQYPHSMLTFRKCDVSSWDEQAKVFKEINELHGGIDIVMANAGLSDRGANTITILDEEEPSAPNLVTVNVNFVGVLYCESAAGIRG